ncbi:hypothetical protein QLQ09_23475 [Brucella sp. NM4]|uniref:hypothetical protein n=1 Tax=Brucella/Ochrobactrum group TaxID=2826938 RepID=UPI0024BD17B1|nr:hypothetical protein [Brucella sp. NM4]WHS33220.1 hypothetical protein QLQ09_23475 [Brucella sp. NM4]WHT43321.1 hypothetical protein QLQ11_15530 [Ochrobactrum sp. SSR]
MATLSDYMSGTISLANGSVTVTGTGTLFEVTRFREGDTLQIQNLTAVIASVDSDTQLTLTEPWTGVDIVDGAYRARQLGDGTRVSTQAATIIELLGNGVLMNLAELGVEEGKVPVGGPTGEYELTDFVQDPNGNLAELAALVLAARQILQTDEAGALKQIALAANKALVTDANGDVVPIDIGTLGRILLALATGTNAQYIQGDGTLQAKAGLPVSTATQTALNAKASRSGDTFTGDVTIAKNEARIALVSAGFVYGTTIEASVSDVSNFGLRFLDSGTEKVRIGGSGAPSIQVYGNASISGTISKGGGTFTIDHPLDPYNRNLRHGFVEAPRYDLIYRGTTQLVSGRATVDIDAASNLTPGTFAALTTNALVTSLQNQDGFARLKPGAINGGAFEIISEDDNCIDHVSWVVIAERNDPFVKSDLDQNTDSEGRFVPEFEKEDA